MPDEDKPELIAEQPDKEMYAAIAEQFEEENQEVISRQPDEDIHEGIAQTPEEESVEEASADTSDVATNVKPKNNAKKTVLTYLHDLVYLLAVVLVLFLVFLRVVVVSGPSMNDTLNNGDYLLLLNGMFFREYKQGDIIVASKDSFRDGEPIIKRVIATEGQTVDIDFENGIVYVDGIALDEPYISSPTHLYEGTVFPLVVEDGHIFVLGDNRMNSKDSRSPEIGQIDCREVLGKAIFLIFPGADYNKQREFDRIGVIR